MKIVHTGDFHISEYPSEMSDALATVIGSCIQEEAGI